MILEYLSVNALELLQKYQCLSLTEYSKFKFIEDKFIENKSITECGK